MRLVVMDPAYFNSLALRADHVAPSRRRALAALHGVVHFELIRTLLGLWRLSDVGGSDADGDIAGEGYGVPARKLLEPLDELIPSPLIRTSRRNGYIAGRKFAASE
jgi:hypothetical protein